ncbi:MAG: ComF family protein [Candidatus Omnitrophica bacterium]|nr:ComF family protein [Candidatus Omnitrophota bacterium]
MSPNPLTVSTQSLSLLGEALLRLVFPAVCSLCRKSLSLEERAVCQSCLSGFDKLGLSPKEAHWRKRTGTVCEGFALYEYRDSLKEFLTRFKFQQQPWLVKPLRAPLYKFLLAVKLETRYDALTPIPMTLSRFVERHYNPAEILAHEIGRLSGIPVVPLLKKIRSTPAQHDLSGEERKTNLRGCFKVRKNYRTAGLRVLLIDDILTTGSTAQEAGRVLKQAGVQYSGVMTLARTLEINHKHENP